MEGNFFPLAFGGSLEKVANGVDGMAALADDLAEIGLAHLDAEGDAVVRIRP